MFIRSLEGGVAYNTQYIKALYVSDHQAKGWYVDATPVNECFTFGIKGPYPSEEMAAKALEELITKIGRDAQ